MASQLILLNVVPLNTDTSGLYLGYVCSPVRVCMHACVCVVFSLFSIRLLEGRSREKSTQPLHVQAVVCAESENGLPRS